METGLLSLWALCEGNLQGVSFTVDPEDYTYVSTRIAPLILKLGTRWGKVVPLVPAVQM